MDKNEYEAMVPSIPLPERKAFLTWYMSYQEIVDWEQFKAQGYQLVAEAVQAIQAHVEKEDGKPQQLQLFAPMPTELARTSPFFPINRKDVRKTYDEFHIDHPWGHIVMSGPQLSIYDESVLLAILLLVKKNHSCQITTTSGELCGLMRCSRGTAQYKAIEKSLIRLAKTTIDTQLQEREGGKKKQVRRITGPMLSCVDQEAKQNKIVVTVNTYFLALYGVSLTTSLDVEKRASLKGDVPKALFRFLETHKPSSTGKPGFGLLVLARAINLSLDKPLIEIRRQIRGALRELRKHNYVKKGWRIDKNDLVVIPR